MSRIRIPDEVQRALDTLLRDPAVHEGVVTYLDERRRELEDTLNKAARMALVNPDARVAALQHLGAFEEVSRAIGIINRWKE